jgi:DNA helicase-2/ATP-dependent DNA helicase PcrA
LSDYLEKLNSAQRAAVECIRGPVMIIAGAGSGKTRVLTYRIAHLLNSGVDSFNILALTFTNKAAKDMKKRITTIVGSEAKNLWMGTFHSVFARLLRFEAEKLGYPSNFTIYDSDDSKGLMKDLLKEQGLDDKQYKPDMVLNRISSAKNKLISYTEYKNDTQIQSDDHQSNKPKLGLLYELYSKRCFKAGAMDFDDLLYQTNILLRDFPDVLYKYQHKFKHILVDEYQDTNFAQYTIIKKLAAVNENICVVGDDAQSIYAFRGATIHNILNFEKDYPDLNVFKLEQNYRSTKNIVSTANSIIQNNRKQIKKDVWTGNEEGDKIKVLKALTDNEEGYLVANFIFEERANKQLSNDAFAILYRTNAQSRSMEEALIKLNIPYRIYGGLSFYKRKEIKDLVGYFRLTINHRDEEALKRIINYPARGIGKTTLDKIIVLADQHNKSLWEILENINQFPMDVSSSVKVKISEFVMMIKSFSVMNKSSNAYELASHIANATSLLKELYIDKTPEGTSRYENIQELLNAIKDFTEKESIITFNPEDGEILTDHSKEMRTLDIFLQDIALLTDADKEDTTNNNKVSLMTIHSSKGLEFSHVFVVGLEENLFPSQMSLNSREDIEEERRLFYVASTRAEKTLVYSYATSRYRWGNLTQCEPSRFLDEIDASFLDAGHKQQRPASKPVFSPKPLMTKSPASPGSAPVKSPVIEGTLYENFIPDDPQLFQVGMEVEHQRFGTGKITLLEGHYPDLKATILFQVTGQKQLLLKFAKLRIKQQ